MTTTANIPSKPTHAIFQLIGETKPARWIRVGAAWTNKDGKGFTMRFDAYPVAGRTVMREIEDRDGEEGGE